MPLVILHHLLNVSAQLANKRDSNKKELSILEAVFKHKTLSTLLFCKIQSNN
jgi:hypothetical protein